MSTISHQSMATPIGLASGSTIPACKVNCFFDAVDLDLLQAFKSYPILCWFLFFLFLFLFQIKTSFLDLKISDFSCLACAKNRENLCNFKRRRRTRIVNMYCSLLFAGNFYYNSFINKADIISIVGWICVIKY